jgi:hypothetical protein
MAVPDDATGGYQRVDFCVGDGLSDAVDSADFAGMPLDLVLGDLRSVYHLPDEVAAILVNDVPVSRTDYDLELGDMVTLIFGSTENLDSILQRHYRKDLIPTDAAEPGIVSGGPAASVPDQVPALSERQYRILQALLELDATSPAKRRPTKDVAEKAEGIEADPEGFKQPITDLAASGFVGTKGGRGGGCWLTATGRAVAEQLKR